MTKILAFAGSLRKDSVNKKLVKYAAAELKKMGSEVTFIDLADYSLPIYNQDISGDEFPKAALALSQIMIKHPVWLISSPEHNYSLSSCIKNLIDWVSRTPDNKPNMMAFTDKVVGLLSASPSAYGGSRGLRHLREILTALNSVVVPLQTSISNAFAVFDEQGNLTDSNGQKVLTSTLQQLTKIAAKLNS
jgi:chromate reductase